MAATTTPVNQPIHDPYYVAKLSILAANEKVPPGSLAMNDAGKIKAATSPPPAGALLLGMTLSTNLYETTGADVTLTGANVGVFARGLNPIYDGLAGDLPLASDVGKSIFVSDNQTVKRTNAGTDFVVTLLAVLPGNKFQVRIP